MADKDLKIEARTYYETHFSDAKEVAQRFNIPLRTLYRWIKDENWQQGAARSNLNAVQNELIRPALASQMDYVKEKSKAQSKEYFTQNGLSFDEEILDESIDEILFEAMSLKFIDKTLIQTALYAKQALKNFSESAGSGGKAELAKINAAKNVCDIFNEVKKSIHGKETPALSVQIANINNNQIMSDEELASLSPDELKKLIAECERA